MSGKPSHGEAKRSGWSTEYHTWLRMKQRCTNPKNPSYPSYGGRGIRVSKRWMHSYQNFLADMGRRPSNKHSLDRIDNDGHYGPGNCRWATASQQQFNRRMALCPHGIKGRSHCIECNRAYQRNAYAKNNTWRRKYRVHV